MRPDMPNKTWGITLVLISLLQGCGHKGPLMLPASQAQTQNPQISDPQKSGLPASQPNK
jgi:predicted small lipoprotein YifL